MKYKVDICSRMLFHYKYKAACKNLLCRK